MLPILILAFYGCGVTLVLFVLVRRRHRRDEVLDRFDEMATAEMPAAERLKAAAEMIKARQGQISWWERSVSAIGVIAFFSMMTATTIQTFRAGLETGRAERLRHEVEILERSQESLRIALTDTVSILVAEAQRGRPLKPSARRLLRQRLELLFDQERREREDLIEIFEIAFALKDYETVLHVLDADRTVLDQAQPVDNLTLAQFYLLNGAPSSARPYLERVQTQASRLPPEWRARLAVVRVALDATTKERSILELAAALDLPAEEARLRLNRGLEQFEEIGELRKVVAASAPAVLPRGTGSP